MEGTNMDYDKLPRREIKVFKNCSLGTFEWWRHSVGHGGVNSLPLPKKVRMGTKLLSPKLIRVFIQEFFNIYPDHGVYDFTKLDVYMDSLASTGAKIVAAICIKPKCLYPTKNHEIFMPNNIKEWQELIYTLVYRYSVERQIVTHWEVGNEVDIGENGGCPYLIENPGDYYEYYKMTIEPILNAFPEAKVGGPALANATEDYMRTFVELCNKENIQLDIVSWHLYSSSCDDYLERLDRVDRALECYGRKRPEVMITEFSKSFEEVSVQDAAFAPSRPAIIADIIFSLLERKVDWTFYYHLWDQSCLMPEFIPFFKEPYIMQRHWNEIPHRFGLFGVNGEVRPTYFVYRMLAMAGDTEIKVEKSCNDFATKAFIGINNAASTMVVNRSDKGPGDMVAIIKFTGLTPGIRTLKNYRIDHNQCWNEENLDFYPVEEREIYINEDYECHIYCPADSVSLLCIV